MGFRPVERVLLETLRELRDEIDRENKGVAWRRSEDPKLTVVIPALNEEETIGETLESLERVLPLPHEVIVVDDSSDDGTARVVRDLSARYPHLRLVFSFWPWPRGITNALKAGFKEVRTPVTVVVMADGTDDPHTIEKMYEKIEEGYDVVCASRYMPGGRRLGEPWLRGLFSRFVCASFRRLTGIPIQDVSNPFKMYRTQLLKDIPLEEAGFGSSLEICVKAFLKGYRIAEVPVVQQGRPLGKSNFGIFPVTRSFLRWYLWAILFRKHRFWAMSWARKITDRG